LRLFTDEFPAAVTDRKHAIRPVVTGADAQPLLNRGLAHLGAGRPADAQAEFEKVLVADPSHFGALNLLSVALMQQRRFAEAEPHMRRAHLQRPRDLTVIHNYGLLLQQLRRFRDALDLFDGAANLAPKDAEIWRQRGHVLRDLGRNDEAATSYAKAIDLAPDDAAAHCSLGGVLHDLVRYEDARSAYEAAIRIRPQPDGYKGRGGALQALGRDREALADYERTIAIAPADAQAHYFRADVLRRLGRREEALSGYGRALAIDPDLAEALIDRARLLREAGQPIEQTAPGGRWFVSPMNGQQARLEIVTALIERCRIGRIVETGTFLGTTTEFFAAFGIPVITAEVDARFASRARRRLYGWKNVDLRAQDSLQVLREIVREDVDRDVATLFYLDAHWAEHLPLREEVEIIVANFPRALIVIDDFAVPHDQGYAFDDYGPGKRLCLEYLMQGRTRVLELFFPSIPADQETGGKRGYVIAANDPELVGILQADARLQQWQKDVAA
jgi:tetratricopeptide (TPR) repeat protein